MLFLHHKIHHSELYKLRLWIERQNKCLPMHMGSVHKKISSISTISSTRFCCRIVVAVVVLPLYVEHICYHKRAQLKSAHSTWCVLFRYIFSSLRINKINYLVYKLPVEYNVYIIRLMIPSLQSLRSFLPPFILSFPPPSPFFSLHHTSPPPRTSLPLTHTYWFILLAIAFTRRFASFSLLLFRLFALSRVFHG